MSLFARLAAAIAILLMGIQLAAVWIYLSERNDGEEPGYRFPLPSRVAAIIELAEQSDNPEQLLVALNGPDFRVDIVGSEAFQLASPEVSVPALEEAFAQYADVFGKRPFAVFVDVPETTSSTDIRYRDTTLWTRFPVRILIGMSEGRVLSIETRGDLLTQVYSVPIGWFSGIFGLIAAVTVLLVVRRETRPIETLARAVERFGEDGRPVDVPESGAPELRSLIKNFNAMQARISDLMARQGVMLGALGHDLRTYLTRLSLRVEDLPDTHRHPMERNIAKIEGIVENSLDYARGASAAAAREEVELQAFLTSWVAERADPRITLTQAAPANVWANPTALERVFANLVENSLKFGNTVRIELSTPPTAVKILDDGPGLPSDDLQRVLEPFVTLDDARTAGRSGTGLGLAIADMLAKESGAALRLSNRPEGGLCAALTFAETPASAPK